MCIGVKGDRIYQGHINLVTNHNTFICRYIYYLADDAASVLSVLIFNKFTLKAEWKFIDDRSVYGFGFTGGEVAVLEFVGDPVT